MDQADKPGAAARPMLSTWPASAQLAIGFLLVAGVFFLVGRFSRDWSQPAPAPIAAAPLDADLPSLDLNRASKAELRLIPGIGDALAQRIIDHRQRNGPFRAVDDLKQVSGIGPKTLERLRPRLFVRAEALVKMEEDESPPPSTAKQAPRPVTASKKVGELTALINVNRAEQAELQKLPGIGPKLSQRILDERAKGPFKTVEDLRRVPGIGPKTLEKIRPYVSIEPAQAVAATGP